MKFSKIFIIFVVLAVLMAGQAEARPGWFKKIGKRLVRNQTI